MITTSVQDATPIHDVILMLGSAVNNFIVLLVKIFQAKKILKIRPLAAEITLMQKSNKKLPCGIGLTGVRNPPTVSTLMFRVYGSKQADGRKEAFVL